jgi:hypothetical protein
MKFVPFFPNDDDNEHCLQACVKSLLAFYLPNQTFSDKEINEKTGGNWAWMPPTVKWLNELGIKAQLYSSFDYEQFASQGESYMKAVRGEQAYLKDKAVGAYNNIPFVQEATKQIIKENLFIKKHLSVEELTNMLSDEKTLAIGKTVWEWMDNNYIEGVQHYVLTIKKYSPGMWKIHDPGLPPKPERKINATINNHPILLDVIVVSGIK